MEALAALSNPFNQDSSAFTNHCVVIAYEIIDVYDRYALLEVPVVCLM